AEVLNALRQATVLCAPSVVEAFNMPLVEAMACGTPIVCADLPLYRDEITRDAAVYVPLHLGGDTAAALATALYGVLTMTNMQDMLSRKGLGHAKHFTWERTAQTIAETVKEVLA
ncbi:MAG: glycosyltransferase, partial [Alphaproteobacteria bacterium]